MDKPPDNPLADLGRLLGLGQSDCKHDVRYDCRCGRVVRIKNLNISKLLKCEPITAKCTGCQRKLRIILSLNMLETEPTK